MCTSVGTHSITPHSHSRDNTDRQHRTDGLSGAIWGAIWGASGHRGSCRGREVGTLGFRVMAYASDCGSGEQMGLDADELEDFHASITANDLAAVQVALFAEGSEDDMGLKYQRAHAVVDSRDARRRSGVHIAALANVTNEMLNLILRATKDVNGRDVRRRNVRTHGERAGPIVWVSVATRTTGLRVT